MRREVLRQPAEWTRHDAAWLAAVAMAHEGGVKPK